MDTVLLLVKYYDITHYLMYSWTVYAIPVSDKGGKFQYKVKLFLNLSTFQYSTWTTFH